MKEDAICLRAVCPQTATDLLGRGLQAAVTVLAAGGVLVSSWASTKRAT